MWQDRRFGAQCQPEADKASLGGGWQPITLNGGHKKRGLRPFFQPINAYLLLIYILEKRGQAGPDEARISDQATLGEAELSLIKQALQRTDRNVSRAARELGITRMALRYRMKKYDL